MPSPEEIAYQQQLLATNRRTLAYYLERQAKLTGANIPPDVFHGIREARDTIRRIKAVLRGWDVRVEDLPDDDAPADAPPGPAAVPSCPTPNAARLVGRQAILDQLIAALTDGPAAIVAVRGLPGVGKTDLLRAIGCDPRTTAHFTGGVLYAELGPAPDPAQILRRWTTELGREPPRSDEVETLAAAVRVARISACSTRRRAIRWQHYR